MASMTSDDISTLLCASSSLALSCRVNTAKHRNGPNWGFLARTVADTVQLSSPAGDMEVTLSVLEASVKVNVTLSGLR